MSELFAGADESLDILTREWRIFQLKRGHRFSTDDLLTAWTAIKAFPDSMEVLDIGSGIGSVGLLTLSGIHPEAKMTSIEIQAVSYELACKTVEYNGLSSRVDLSHGDLRDHESLLEIGRKWRLITGSPPYIPLGKGVCSPHPQRAGARMELKGSVYDYCKTAAARLSPRGVFCFVHSASDPRPELAIKESGLTLLHRQNVVFREGLKPTIALFKCGWGGERDDLPDLVVRNSAGEWTDDYHKMRDEMGVPNLRR
jgi:tRNA1Val (adenine37-N6)-methyltransferase